MTIQLVKNIDAAQKLGISRSSFWSKQDSSSPTFDPTFPIPVRVGARSTGWLEHELDEWILKQAAKRQQPEGEA